MLTQNPIRPGVIDVEATKIHPLTSMRFFAALYVVMFHWLTSVPPKSADGFIFRFVSVGGVSVSFFYLLSGFILAHVYLRSGRRFEKRRFYRARFARIYPIYLLTLLADAPLYFFSQLNQRGTNEACIRTGIRMIGSLFMLQAWSPVFRGIDFPNWSISVETVFYAIFPFIGLLLWRLRGTSIWFAMLTVYIVGQGVVLFVITMAGNDLSTVDKMLYFPPLHVTTFVLGILLARFQTLSRPFDQGNLNKVWPQYFVLGMSAGLYLAIILFTSTDQIRSVRGGVLLRDGLLAPIFCGIIWALSSKDTLPSRLLSNKWLVILGECSYALYLIHFPVLHAMGTFYGLSVRARTHAGFAVRYSLEFLVFLAICIFLSFASFYWIENPARRSILRFLNVRSIETAETASDAQ